MRREEEKGEDEGTCLDEYIMENDVRDPRKLLILSSTCSDDPYCSSDEEECGSRHLSNDINRRCHGLL